MNNINIDFDKYISFEEAKKITYICNTFHSVNYPKIRKDEKSGYMKIGNCAYYYKDYIINEKNNFLKKHNLSENIVYVNKEYVLDRLNIDEYIYEYLIGNKIIKFKMKNPTIFEKEYIDNLNIDNYVKDFVDNEEKLKKYCGENLTKYEAYKILNIGYGKFKALDFSNIKIKNGRHYFYDKEKIFLLKGELEFKSKEKKEKQDKFCIVCNKVMPYRNKKFCSKECEKKFIENNEDYRKKMTEKAKEKNIENGKNGLHWMQSDSDKKDKVVKCFTSASKEKNKILAKNGQIWNQKIENKEKLDKVIKKIHTKESAKKVSKALTGRKLTQEHKDAISKSRKERGVAKGKLNPMYGKAAKSTNGDYKGGHRNDIDNIYFRSSWEANIARVFKYKNIEFEFEEHRFELIVNGVETVYIPDFFIKQSNMYVEVKGYWREDAKIKFECFKNQYKDIKIMVIGPKEYKNIEKIYKNIIINWEK